jgi:hypothetical protein
MGSTQKMEEYHMKGSVLNKYKLQKLVIFVDDAFLKLIRTKAVTVTDFDVTIIPLHFVKYPSYHGVVLERKHNGVLFEETNSDRYVELILLQFFRELTLEEKM